MAYNKYADGRAEDSTDGASARPTGASASFFPSRLTFTCCTLSSLPSLLWPEHRHDGWNWSLYLGPQGALETRCHTWRTSQTQATLSQGGFPGAISALDSPPPGVYMMKKATSILFMPLLFCAYTPDKPDRDTLKEQLEYVNASSAFSCSLHG